MLDTQDYRDREIRAAIKEQSDLRRRRHTIHRLAEPIQQGWRRFHTLTERAENREDRDVLAAIVAVIGTERFCNRPDFRHRRSRSRKLFDLEQPLERLFDWQWVRRGAPREWLPYFRWHHYVSWGRECFHGEFLHPGWLELRVEPNWISEVAEVDPDIETRLAELDRWLCHRSGYHRYDWLKGRSHDHWWRFESRAHFRERQGRHAVRLAMQGEVEARTPARRLRLSLSQVTISDRSRSPRAEAAGLNPVQCQCESDREHFSCPRSPTSRGTELKPRPVQVRILPRVPLKDVSEVFNFAETFVTASEVGNLAYFFGT